MSVRESLNGFVIQSPNYRYPADDEGSRIPPPTLPPMSSLLSRNEQRRYEHQHYPQSGYQLPPNHMQQHPLWHSEQNPDAPPQHIYHPPQNPKSHTTEFQAEPLLVTNPQGMAVPVSHEAPLAQRRQVKKISQRRGDLPKEYDESQRSASVMEARYTARGEQHPHEREKLPIKRQDSMRSETSSSRKHSSQNSRSMPISGLLSGNPSHTIERAPPAKYTIRMRQEPMAARACGFGERDRRVIDPPPILQMDVESPTSTPEAISAMIRNPYTVVHCTLWDPVADKDDTAMPGTTDKRQQRRLMGTLVASPFVGMDEHDIEGCFFTFPDLSVRTPGTYSLKFSLVVLDPQDMMPGTRAAIRSTAMSSAFTVYNAKDFCGMRASTELTKRLKHQGCLISVKKGNAKSNGGTHRRDEDDDDDEEDDDEDDAGDSGVKRGKRPKR